MQRRFRISGMAFCVGLVAFLLLFLGMGHLQAADFPTKPINLIIPLAAGGSNDITARTFVHLSPEILGQPMVVQCKPGGGGSIGSELVGQAKPDGHTLLFGHSNCNSVLPAAEGRSRGPDDLAPVCRINVMDYILVTRADSPFKNFKEMIAWAKANPGKLTFAALGPRGWTGYEWRNLELKTGIKTKVVIFDGGGEIVPALLGGHVQIGMFFPSNMVGHFKAGTLRPLAVYGAKRYAHLPDVPTVKEDGYTQATPGGIWKGVMAPKGTPRPIIDKLALGFKKMTEHPQAMAAMKQLGDEFVYQGPDEFAKFWREDYETFKKLAATLKD